MTGKGLCRLMRLHRITVRTLAQRLGVSQARVRQVRTQGLTDWNYVRDWHEAITGVDPGA